MSSPCWRKFELLAEKTWIVSVDAEFEETAPEIAMIKKLAKCDSKMYLKFNEKTQNDIQFAIEDALEYKTSINRRLQMEAYPGPSLGDLSIDDIRYDFFGITCEAQLKIWPELNGTGIIRVWNTTPTMINDIKVKTFPACIVSPLNTNIKIIEDTQRLLTETCIPNGELLGHGYCRKYEVKEEINIPIALRLLIICYFNVNNQTLNKYWIINE